MAVESLLGHNEACRKLVDFFKSRGAEVRQEVDLPEGRGAVDVVVSDGKIKRYFEVKSHPTSIRQGGLQKQFRRYEETFPGQSYFLAFPLNELEMVFVDYKSEKREIIKL